MKRRDVLKVAACAGAAAPTTLAEARPNLQPPENAVGMLYDSTLCIGCKACMVRCKEVNDLPPETRDDAPVWDAALGLSGKTVNVIKAWRDGTAEVKDRPEDGYAFIKRHCMHCVDAGCVSVCPVNAMRKDPETGVVTHHPEACIGCRYCVYACPYNVPKFDFDGPFGQIRKCQFCNQAGVERLDRGLLPGCVEACPTGASLFGTREELRAEARRRLALQPGEEYDYPRGRVGEDPHRRPAPAYQPELYGERQGGGTQVMHLAAVPFADLGLPDLPEQSFAARSETVQHTIYSKMIAPLVLLGGLAFVVRRNLRRHGQDEGDGASDHDREQEH